MTRKINNQFAYKYAIIVPCYNEENRFPFKDFLAFAKSNQNVLLCMVNDGSKDNTLAVLRGLQMESPNNVCTYSLERNQGKSEAVRRGILYVYNTFEIDHIGFLDADLATLPEEWLKMAKYKEQFDQFGAIVGSRIQRLGVNIVRNDNRSILSNVVKKFIQLILKANFQDTQCGAKIFHRTLIPFLFNKPFLTPWLFDIEIFLRLQNKFGKSTLNKGVLEFPLMQWLEIGGSKLKLKDSLRIPGQLIKLYFKYRISARFKSIRVFDFAKRPKKSVLA